MVRWFIIVGTAAGAAGRRPCVRSICFRRNLIKEFFASTAAADQRQHRHGEVRSHSEPPDRGRRSCRRASGQRHLRRQRPHHRHHVHRRRQREGGHAAGAVVRCAGAGRSRQLQGAVDDGAALARSRQATGLAPVRTAGDRRPGAGAFDQANAGIAKTEAIISQKLVRAPFDGELGVRKVEVGQYLTAGTQIVSLTDLSVLYANFTVTEKDSPRSRSVRSSASRSMPIRAAPSRARSRPSNRRSRPTRATSACRRRSQIPTVSSSPACSRPPPWCCRTSRR